MNPLYFGTSQRALFGVYHPPRARDARRTGVVLCYPVGQEYMRAHRAFRQLAILLSRAGFPVLRFDYYGTGDSAGDGDAGSLEQWMRDIEVAIDELKDNAAVDRVSLVGLRLGAPLVAAAQARRPDVVSAVLWDPVVEGEPYFAEILATALEGEGDGDARRPPGEQETVGIYGFPWTPALRREVRQVAPASYAVRPDSRVAVFVSSDRPDYARLRDHLAAHTSRLEFRCIPSPGDWAYIDAYGSALLPQEIIQGIVNHLAGETLS